MTSHPIAENASAWWLTCGKWRRLHAIPAAAISQQRMRDAIDDEHQPHARAACRLPRRWAYPGMGSRFGLRRCAPCCAALGIPSGRGTPSNEADMRAAR